MVDWDALAADYDKIRDAIARVVPGCEDYNARVREPGGFYLPNPPRERDFRTGNGKANFIATPLELLTSGSDQLLLTTIRSHNQFNTTIYNNTDRYRGISGSRRVIFMNAADIERLGLTVGQIVDITSHFEDGERQAFKFAIVEYPIPKGCAAAYFPEANPLVPLESFADKSMTPTSKSLIVSVQPAGTGEPTT
jgi:anaerobic selenocysteine-containing dehydrogenase